MDTKFLIDTFDLRWFGELHDSIEVTLRDAGALVFRVYKVRHHHIWRVVALLPGGGGPPVRLQFAARMRDALAKANIIEEKAEVHAGGSGERITLSFIAEMGEFGGICYHKTNRGRIVSCREHFFYCEV
ncbi:MAG: hypothetical protein ACK4UN_10840 [Limisphaerales bacterium]